MSSITTPSDFSKIKTWEELKRWVAAWAVDITNQVNGNLDFNSNLRCKLVDVVFTAANTDKRIAHSLGKIPTGYILVKTTASANLYDGSIVADADIIVLKSTATFTGTILFF